MELVVNSSEKIERIDLYLSARFFDLSRSSIVKLIDSGNVLVNGKKTVKKYLPKPGDFIQINFLASEFDENNILAENIPLDIIYEDDFLMVINKPKGMVVHPAPGHYKGTLVNALMFYTSHLSDLNSKMRPGIIHRIDKDTSGVLLIAKNNFVHENLSNQIKNKTARREYRGIVHGILKSKSGKIDLPIGRDTKDRKKMAVTDKNSKNAITYYEVIESYKNYSYMKFLLDTGRTHQIRVHMSKIGHPLAGDITYGAKNDPDFLHGQCLHAKKITFFHPIFEKKMEFTSNLPDEFLKFINYIGFNKII